MTPLRWRRLRFLSLSIALLPACFSYQTRRGAVLQPKADVSVRFASPRTVTVTPWDTKEPDRTCQETRVTGTVSSITGDTIRLRPLRYPLHAAADDQPCLRGRAARFERGENDQVMVRGFSARRVGSLLGVVALFVGFAAYAASQI